MVNFRTSRRGPTSLQRSGVETVAMVSAIRTTCANGAPLESRSRMHQSGLSRSGRWLDNRQASYSGEDLKASTMKGTSA
jgi:hypothetical protein